MDEVTYDHWRIHLPNCSFLFLNGKNIKYLSFDIWSPNAHKQIYGIYVYLCPEAMAYFTKYARDVQIDIWRTLPLLKCI